MADVFLQDLFEVWNAKTEKLVMVVCARSLSLAIKEARNALALHPGIGCREEDLFVAAAKKANVSAPREATASRFGIWIREGA